jgi:hypothetical protein
VSKGHWSDCAVHRAPAYEPGPCNCGGLDLAAYERYVAVTALIPTPGSLAAFIANGELPSLVETEQAPLAVIGDDQPPTGTECVTGDVPPHKPPRDSALEEDDTRSVGISKRGAPRGAAK